MSGKCLLSLAILTVTLVAPWHQPFLSADQKGFSMPRTAPLYQPPPWEYQGNRAIIILFETTRDILTELVPEPLIPHAVNYGFVYVGRYNMESPEKLTFHEAGIGVLSSYDTTQGKFAVYMYADKVLPVAAAREIWGSPKKGAEIEFREDEKTVSATVSRGGKAIIKATLTKDKKLDLPEDRPPMPWFALKLIPSVKKGARPDVMQLTKTTVKDRFKELYGGKATLEFGSTSEDPLGKLKILGLASARFAVYDFDIGFGEVLHDYLAEKKQ